MHPTADHTVHRALEARRIRFLLPLYLFLTFAYFLPGASWNPVSRYSLTRAIVEHGTFEITAYAESTGDRAVIGNRFHTDKAPIPSILAIPAYSIFYEVAKLRRRLPAFRAEGTAERPARRVVVSPAFRTGLYVSTLSTAGLAAALLGLFLYEILLRRVGAQAAALGALSTVLGTPIFPYATSFFGHTIAGAFLFGAFFVIEARVAPASLRRTAAGALLALGAGSEYVATIPGVFLAGYFIVNAPGGQRPKAALSLALGALVPLGFLGYYHTACFGAPWRTGYSFVTHPAFAPGHAQGLLGFTYPKLGALWGILFGSARGLFYLSPICAVGLLAGVLAYRQSRDRALLVSGLVLAALVFINASYYQWDGGWAAGPRHVVPALGFLGLGIGLAFSNQNFRVMAAALSAPSIAIMVGTTAIGLETPPDQDAVFDYLIPAVDAGQIARVSGASNLGILLGLGRKASLLPIALWVAAGTIAIAWLASRGSPQAPSGGEPDSEQREQARVPAPAEHDA